MKTTYALSTAFLAGLAAGSPLPQSTSTASCKTYTLLFARGTTETGTLGTVVGPGLENSVESALGADQVTVQGVEYAADAAGITSEATGSGPGSVAMADDATTWLSNCPDTKIILTGYSQGAMVVHNTASKLNSANKIASVVAAVTFGDPFKTQLPIGIDTAEFHTFCASDDSVCGTTGTCAGSGGCTSASTMGHLGYGSDVDTAASFIKSVVGGSTSGSTATASSSPSTTTTAANSNADSGSDSGFDFGTGLSSLPTGLGSGFSIPTALPTLGSGSGSGLGSGLGSGFSIPAFSVPTSVPTGLSGLGSSGL
ncbi:cutinase [Seiridium cupressi]